MRPLRGGDDAHRHRRELRGRGLRTLAKGLGALARDVSEGATKRAEAFPTRLEGDVRDGQIRVPQERRGFLDPAREQVAMRRHAESFLELAREVGCRDAAHLCETFHRPGLVRSRIHAVLRAQQAAKELGVLG
jgi:hypothetical protein